MCGPLDGFRSAKRLRLARYTCSSQYREAWSKRDILGDNSIVERRRPDYYGRGCVCYNSHRLPLGQVWQITLLNTTSKWSAVYGGLVSGYVLFFL